MGYVDTGHPRPHFRPISSGSVTSTARYQALEAIAGATGGYSHLIVERYACLGINLSIPPFGAVSVRRAFQRSYYDLCYDGFPAALLAQIWT
jgi:hypothetical protein